MTGRSWMVVLGVAIVAIAAPGMAQQVSPTSAGNAGEAGSMATDQGGEAADRGGLSGRGGTAINTGQTYRETIGTPIYTPIGTSMFSPVQKPPETQPRG